jgi:ATP-binding cassette subfamily B (MDR/TAP) protein 1
MMGLGQFFLYGANALSLWYGGKLISDGEVTFVEVMKVIMAVMMSSMSLGQSAARKK